jgi:hypothetical protein
MNVKASPKHNKRGASTVTYAMVLPLFILLIFGTFEIWRVISIRQSMERGVYRAARLLSQRRTPVWQDIARNLALSELTENAWLMSTNASDLELITVPTLSDLVLLQSGDKFVVQVHLWVPVGDLGFLDLFERGAPVRVKLKAQCTTFVDLATPEWEEPDEIVAY